MNTIKDIPGYEGLYAVTPDGKIWSHPKHGRKGGWMSPNKQKAGYVHILFSVNKVRKTLKVHRLVGMVYLPKIKGKDYINHKNGIKHDNRVENLEWCTLSENTKHGYKVLGRTNSDKQRESAKIIAAKYLGQKKKIKQYSLDGKYIKTFESVNEAYMNIDVKTPSSISLALHGKRKSAGGYVWKFST